MSGARDSGGVRTEPSRRPVQNNDIRAGHAALDADEAKVAGILATPPRAAPLAVSKRKTDYAQ